MTEPTLDAAAPAGHPPNDMWFRLADHFDLVTHRPLLDRDVLVERDKDEVVLTNRSSGAAARLTRDEVEIVRMFDGSRTVGEIIVQQIERDRSFDFSSVLSVIDRLGRAGLVVSAGPNVYDAIHIEIGERAAADVEAAVPAPAPTVRGAAISQYENVPWRPRTPMLAARARFLHEVGLLRGFDIATIGHLAEAAHEEAFPAASTVVKEGSLSDRFFVIKSGEAIVQRTLADGSIDRIARLGTGDTFGEEGILDMSARNATVRSGPARPLVLLSFDAGTFERLIAPNISGYRERHHFAIRREKLRAVPLFSSLDDAAIESLANVVDEHRVDSGTVIAKQGDHGDRFYVIVRGSVRVDKDGAPVATLSSGDFFGETALLFTQERTATVTAMEQTTLWSLDATAFQHLLRTHLMGRRDLMPELVNRARS